MIVPEESRAQILDTLHQDHPGIVRMKALARSYMWWPGMDQVIEKITRACQRCQVPPPPAPGSGQPLHLGVITLQEFVPAIPIRCIAAPDLEVDLIW